MSADQGPIIMVFFIAVIFPLVVWAVCQGQINTLEKKIEGLAQAAKDKAA